MKEPSEVPAVFIDCDFLLFFFAFEFFLFIFLSFALDLNLNEMSKQTT